MDLILAKKNGEQVGVIQDPVLDCDCNGASHDFSLSVSVADWDGSMDFGMRLFIPDEEYGGVIGQIMTDTELGTITVSGHTWRGMLADKVIEPPSGSDYRTVSGEANTILRDLIDGCFSGAIVGSGVNSMITIGSYQFKRYCTLLEGLTDMLKAQNARLDLRYDEMSDCMVVSAVSIVDYSYEIELSQDYDLQFTYDDVRDKPNHLIVGGQGELAQREILHLYTDADGNISTTQTLTGLDEVEVFWENTSSDQLEADARKHFEEIRGGAKLSMEIESIPDEARIGDIVGGRDYITGRSMKAPIGNIILQISGDTETKTYKLEEDK